MDILDGSRNLTQQLAYELGKAILQGKYQVDMPFPTEAQLSTQYSISRSVTREAVKMLTAKGLICSRPRKGIRVQPASQWNMFDSEVLKWTLSAKPSLQLLKEFTQLRIAIEPEAAALAAAGASAAQLEALERALQRIEAAEQNEDEPLAAEIEFHTRLLEASNNRFFVQFADFIRTALQIRAACSNQLTTVRPAGSRAHRRILRHIAAGQAEQGRGCLRMLLDEALHLILDSIAAKQHGNAPKRVIVV